MPWWRKADSWKLHGEFLRESLLLQLVKILFFQVSTIFHVCDACLRQNIFISQIEKKDGLADQI